MSNISGTVHVRPVRVGLLASTISESTLVTAARLAASAWGGVFYPILSLGDPQLARSSEVLALDVWHPLDDDPATEGASRSPGLSWRGRSPWGPFDPPRDRFATRVLPATSFPRVDAPPVVLPTWDDRDDLAQIFEAWFGRHEHDGRCEKERSSYCQSATDVEVDEAIKMFALGEAVGPIEATRQGLSYTGDGEGVAIAVIAESIDLARFWNLRASGCNVFPWHVAQSRRLVEPLRLWLRELIRQSRLHRDGTGERRFLPVDARPGIATNDLEEIISGEGVTAWTRHESVVWARGWTGYHPVQSELERAFAVPVSADDWDFDIQLPAAVASQRGVWPGIVAAEIDFYSESQLLAGRTVCVPALRNLAPLLDQASKDMEAFTRPTGDGRVVAVQANAETVNVPILPVSRIFERLFEPTNWRVGQSDEGRFATQFVHRFGGPSSAAACEPAVRAVLHEVSRASRAKPIAALIQRAEDARGLWPASFAGEVNGRSYAEKVVYRLIGSKLLLPTLTVHCPRCAIDVDLRPDDLEAEQRCQLCDADFPLGLALALHRRDGWRYRLAANLAPDRLRSALPIAAALNVVATSHRAGGGAGMPHVLGLTVESKGWRCEIDIAATVLDGPTTVVVIGEVKGGSDQIDPTDMENLARVQAALRGEGVEALILAATTRAALTPDERSLLRSVCEEAPERLHRSGSSGPALPIVLTERDLSTPWISEDHPWRWGGIGGRVLEGVATESCKRNLGLNEVDYPGHAIPHRCLWTDDSTSPSS